MQFQLITPEQVIFSGAVTEVTIPGELGDFGVLDGHAPLISTLKPGVVVIRTSEGQVHKVAVLGGVAEAIPERCTVLAETARELDSVTREQLEAELQAAEKKAHDAIKPQEVEAAEQALLMAQTALQAL